jgi:hypothetical protein
MEAEMGVKLRDRDPIYQCWRVAAVLRCVQRYGMGRDQALTHLRALDPTGRKDHLVDIWLMGMSLTQRKKPAQPPQEEPARLAA